jgi:Omp85 superfamily domain
LRIVTPRLGFGRLVFDASGLLRYHNFLNRTSYLGGEGRLRGYPSNYFFGKDIVAYNLEFRSRPLELLSVQFGAAAFFDVGHAADALRDLHPRKSAGIGLRMLFPQLNRVVFRADVGFPLAHRLDPGVSPWSATIAFEQAFTLPGVGGRYATVGGAPVGWLGQ